MDQEQSEPTAARDRSPLPSWKKPGGLQFAALVLGAFGYVTHYVGDLPTWGDILVWMTLLGAVAYFALPTLAFTGKYIDATYKRSMRHDALVEHAQSQMRVLTAMSRQMRQLDRQFFIMCLNPEALSFSIYALGRVFLRDGELFVAILPLSSAPTTRFPPEGATLGVFDRGDGMRLGLFRMTIQRTIDGQPLALVLHANTNALFLSALVMQAREQQEASSEMRALYVRERRRRPE